MRQFIAKRDSYPRGLGHPLALLVWSFAPYLHYKIPLYSSRIKAGFPSPADDYLEQKLDLNEFLIKHPVAVETSVT